MQSFAANLKRIRKEAGYTQEELAENLNVTRQAISCWERGRTEPDIAMLIALSKTLNVSTEELIFGRKSLQYSRLQKKYLVCSIGFLSICLVIFLLQMVLSPYFKNLVNMTYKGAGIYFLVFRLLMPTVGCISFGVFAVSFIALFYEVCIYGWWKKGAFLLGLIIAFPILTVILDAAFSMLFPQYRALLLRVLFVETSNSQLLQMLLFTFCPIISGILLFLGINKKSCRDS